MTTPKNPPETIEERLMLLERQERERIANERRKAFKDSFDARWPKTTTLQNRSLPPKPPLPRIGPRVGIAANAGTPNDQRQHGGDGGLATWARKGAAIRHRADYENRVKLADWYRANGANYKTIKAAAQAADKADLGLGKFSTLVREFGKTKREMKQEK